MYENRESIRKTIFRSELSSIFESRKTDDNLIAKLIHTIFENPSDLSLQLILKKEINDLDELDARIREVISHRYPL